MSNQTRDRAHQPTKVKPAGARQHTTAGPYSPVLEINAERLVVISGQVAVDFDGSRLGDTVEAQTHATLANCSRLLATAGCTFADVFKTNIFLVDLDDWEAFNVIYEATMPEPLPVRTAIQAGLMPGYLVEVEMWAAKPVK